MDKDLKSIRPKRTKLRPPGVLRQKGHNRVRSGSAASHILGTVGKTLKRKERRVRVELSEYMQAALFACVREETLPYHHAEPGTHAIAECSVVPRAVREHHRAHAVLLAALIPIANVARPIVIPIAATFDHTRLDAVHHFCAVL